MKNYLGLRYNMFYKYTLIDRCKVCTWPYQFAPFMGDKEKLEHT